MLIPTFAGTKTFKIHKTKSAKFINIASSMNVKTYNHKFIDESFYADVLYHRSKELSKVLDSLSISHVIANERGFIPRIYSFRKRYGIIFGLIVAFALIIFMPKLLWSIEIIGNEKISNESILSSLEKSGFKIGSYLPDINSDKIESETLAADKRLSWISVNIDGSSAFVEVRESKELNYSKRELPFANIVASEDAIIESIEVYSGIASVKKSNFVRKGELLINGIIQKEAIGTHITYASGKVFGKIFKEYKIDVPYICDIFSETGNKKYSITLQLFSEEHTLNVSLSDYQFSNETTVDYMLSNGKKKMPFSLSLKKISEISKTSVKRTFDEADRIAHELLEEKIKSEFKDCKIISKETEIIESEKGISLFADVWLIADIGITKEFNVSE